MTREELEQEFARRLTRAGREARDILIRVLEDGTVTDDEWAEISRVYAQPIQAQLEKAYYNAAEASSEALGVGFDPDLTNREAIGWSRQYTENLMLQLNANTRQLLQESLRDYFAQSMTLEDLTERLTRAFSASRAATIAITETTRAASTAESDIANRLKQLGLQPVLVWLTANDDITCRICGPRNGKRQGDGWNVLPPAHPRCRCTLRTELITS